MDEPGPMASDIRQRLSRRSATDEDVEWARAVHHRALREVVERQFGPWNEVAQDAFFDQGWTGGAFEILSLDRRPCGYVSIEYRPDDVHLRELVVDLDFQDQGIGTVVVGDMVETAQQQGLPAVLETLRENRAQGLYRRLGFMEFGRTDTHILFRVPAP